MIFTPQDYYCLNIASTNCYRLMQAIVFGCTAKLDFQLINISNQAQEYSYLFLLN